MSSSTFGPIRQWVLAGCDPSTRPELTCSICRESELCLPAPGSRLYSAAEEVPAPPDVPQIIPVPGPARREDIATGAVEHLAGPATPTEDCETWENLVVSPCGHYMGHTCLESWIWQCLNASARVTCPVCRFDMTCECSTRAPDPRNPIYCFHVVIPRLIQPSSVPLRDWVAKVPPTIAEGASEADVRAEIALGCADCTSIRNRVMQTWRVILDRNTPDLTRKAQDDLWKYFYRDWVQDHLHKEIQRVRNQRPNRQHPTEWSCQLVVAVAGDPNRQPGRMTFITFPTS